MRHILTAAAFAFALATTIQAVSAAEDDWQILFDGKNFDAWQNASGGAPNPKWSIEDGAMVRAKGAGYIWTKQRFGDFVLDLEFMTEGNSGVFFRTDNPRSCVQTGIEMQVLRPVKTPTKHSCGSLYDLMAPSKEACKAGQWNHLVLTAKGGKITIEINGQQVIDADLDNWTTAHKNPDGSKNKYKNALKDFKRNGHIGFQDHGAAVSYRNVKIKSL